MAKDKNNMLFDASMPMDEVRKRLEKVCTEVTPKGKKNFLVKHDKKYFVVSKEKEGYKASVNIPLYVFFILWLLLSLLYFFIKYYNNGGMTPDYISSAIGGAIGGGLIPAVLLYWIFAEINIRCRKDDLNRFCKEVKD